MDGSDLWILSYDVDGRERTTAARVCQIVFGRRNTTTREGRPQSVLILPRKDALDLKARLEGLGATVGLGRLAIEPQELRKFRRRRPGSQ